MKQQIAASAIARRNQFIVPVIVAMVILSVPTTLIAVALHSPYTHSNLMTYFDSNYTRTDKTEVGAPLLYHPPALAVQVDATAPIEERGKALFVARGCAGCHGIDGKGGPVGPQLVTDIEVIRQNVRTGPGGMPAFSPQVVTDYDLTAIAAYLKSVSQ